MKRTICVLLSLLLCLALLPTPEVRAANEVWDGTVDISWYDPAASEYEISTPAQLAGLAALVNGMADPTCPDFIGDAGVLESIPVHDFLLVGAGGGNVSDTVYASGIDFAYKTVYLTADMDMGGVFDAATGTWSGPNWTPIGGKFPMLPDEVAGDCLTLDTRFNGVLDGQGHSITNLYCDRYAAKGFPYSMAIGVVGYLGGVGGVDNYSGNVREFENGWQPGVRNLVIASGSIRGRRMVGGIVGRVDETSDGVFIENCANFAAVRSTDAKGVGGIVGSGWGKGVIRGCYNAGAISTTYSSPAGGIIGTEGGMDIYCCYNVAPIDTNGQSRGRAIGSHDTGAYTVANCVYLDGSGDDPANPGFYVGASKRVSVSVTGMTAEELKSDAALVILNTDGAVFAADANGVNGGYPVLWFQNGGNSGECALTLEQPAEGGTVTIEQGETVRYGESVKLSYTAAPGYELDYFTVNGAPISADVFTATGDAVVSAVFKLLRFVTLTLPESRDFYVAAACDGLQKRTGDQLREGDRLTLLLHGYDDASPEDMDLEYIDAYELTLSGAQKNADGTWTVAGTEDVTAQVSRRTQPKQWITLADTGWYTRDPQNTEYTLSTPEALAGLAYLVNRRGLTFAGVTIKLGADISLENTDGTVGRRWWTPIGSSVAKSFQGVFDGQDQAIYNMEIDETSSYAALFGCCTNAEICNLSVYGSVKSSASSAYAAGVAAYVSGGSIINCSSYAEVSASGTHAAGIAAMLRDGAKMEDCCNYGAVSAASGLGGLVGVSDGGEDVITRCANFGAITSTGNNTYGTGGVAGRLAGTVSESANFGAVAGTDRYTGGLVGYATTKNHSTILDCVSSADVASDNAMATAALGGVVGYAQFLSMGNVDFRGKLLPGVDFTSEHVGPETGRVGTAEIKTLQSDAELPAFEEVPARTFPDGKKDSYTARFVADGETVAERSYTPGMAAVEAPPVPQRDGYTAYWDTYALGERDLTVRAIYRPRLVSGGDVIRENGTYFVAWFSSGTITVSDGADVTLRGVYGGEYGFDALTISVGNGASLTLEDMNLSGEQTMLEFDGNNTLTLSGVSHFVSRAEADGNSTVHAKGDLTVDGDGALYVLAGLRNPALEMDAGHTLTLRGGLLSVTKDTLLGVEGGAVQAIGSNVTVCGGKLRGHTDNDNVAVLAADTLTLTSGEVLAQAEASPVALMADVTATGGTIAVQGHTGNYTEEDAAYSGADACSSYSGIEFAELLPFTDVFAADDFYDAVAKCYADGIFKGVADDRFGPVEPMNRAMFVTVLYRMAGQPAVRGVSPFTDLAQDWYRDAVSWAVAQGITKGTSDTEFSPTLPVTREQAAVFLYRFAAARGELARETTDYGGSVGTLSTWAEAETLWALESGLFSGARHAMTAPQDFAPRALLAVVLSNYLVQ